MPKLSIITVNLNNKAGMINTAQSVIAQTYDDYEWIVIDGGSIDGSVEIINEYANKTTKITYRCSEKDDGIYYGMNKGIVRASGEYCYFLNSGDYIRTPNTLEKIFTFDFDEDIVYGNMMLEKNVNSNNNYIIRKFPQKIHPSDLLYGILPHQNMFIKTELLGSGYRTNYKIVSDWLHYTEAICKGKASYKHIPLIFAVNQGEGISDNPKHWNVHKAERKKAICEIFSNLERMLYFFSIASIKNKIDKIRYRYERAFKR